MTLPRNTFSSSSSSSSSSKSSTSEKSYRAAFADSRRGRAGRAAAAAAAARSSSSASSSLLWSREMAARSAVARVCSPSFPTSLAENTDFLGAAPSSAATEKAKSASVAGVAVSAFSAFGASAPAAAWTCLSSSGNGLGSSPGFSSAFPTQKHVEKTIMESNQSSRLSRSLLLTLSVKYRVARDRTMVPHSFRRPNPGYSMYITGFWVSSLASDPRRPSFKLPSWPGNTVM